MAPAGGLIDELLYALSLEQLAEFLKVTLML